MKTPYTYLVKINVDAHGGVQKKMLPKQSIGIHLKIDHALCKDKDSRFFKKA
jgi:hypothetical protein